MTGQEDIVEFSEVLQNRRSIRCFNDQKIERETLVDIVRDAQRTPSWANSQPRRAYLATGKTLMASRSSANPSTRF